MSRPAFVVVVHGAIVRDGRYLMIVRALDEEQAPGALGFPGGKVERTDGPDQVLEQTLRREVAEEVGLEIAQETFYLESAAFTMDTGEPAVSVVFLCQYRGTGEPVSESDEVDSASWMTPSEVVADPRAPEWMPATIERAERLRGQVGW
jgi:8-oxo-dGTP pyrophosphatase MutT (NUDIX family)